MQYRLAAAVLLLLISDSAVIQAQNALQIKIITPKDGALVAHREQVSGTVSDSSTAVWLVIHPLNTSDFFIQPPIMVRNDGTWKVMPYFGRSPSQDSGAQFEVRAFAKPATALKEGVATSWPESAARSNVVEVSRK